MPPEVDPEIADLAEGFAVWGIRVNVIQPDGWPWVLISSRQFEPVSMMIDLWNTYQGVLSGKEKKWAALMQGKFFIPHPLYWQSNQDIFRMGEEFGQFIQNLPPNALSETGHSETKNSLVKKAKQLKASLPEKDRTETAIAQAMH